MHFAKEDKRDCSDVNFVAPITIMGSFVLDFSRSSFYIECSCPRLHCNIKEGVLQMKYILFQEIFCQAETSAYA